MQPNWLPCGKLKMCNKSTKPIAIDCRISCSQCSKTYHRAYIVENFFRGGADLGRWSEGEGLGQGNEDRGAPYPGFYLHLLGVNTPTFVRIPPSISSSTSRGTWVIFLSQYRASHGSFLLVFNFGTSECSNYD